MEILVAVVVLVPVFLIVSSHVVVHIIVPERLFWIVLVLLSLYRPLTMPRALVCSCDLVVAASKLFEEKKLLGTWFGFAESKSSGLVSSSDSHSSCT